MAAAGIILIPILFIIAVFCMAIIPVVVALIYRGSYNPRKCVLSSSLTSIP